MAGVARVTVSLEPDLLKRFERLSREQGFPTRSEAIKDAIRRRIMEEEWSGGEQAAGAVAIVYDHHRSAVLRRLTHVQHDFTDVIISVQHVHLDHRHCLEFIAVRGKSKDIRNLVRRLRSVKGLMHSEMLITATGEHVH